MRMLSKSAREIVFLCLPLLWLTQFRITSAAFERSEYLYFAQKEAEHVIDFLKPESWHLMESIPKEFHQIPNSNDTRPAFLSSVNNGNRIVEFYSPWCGHCKNFAPKYMKLASETFNSDPEIKFYAISCTANHDICKSMDIHGYPTVILLKANSTARTTLNVRDLFDGPSAIWKEINKSDAERKRFADNIQYLTGKKEKKEKKNEGKVVISKNVKNDHIVSHQRPKHVKIDASNSVYFNLRNEIHTSLLGLDDEQSTALYEWFHLISNTIPADWDILKMNNELISNIDEISKDEKFLINIVNKYQVGDISWSKACDRTESGSGYTCGLWELFHVISVGLVEHNKNSASIDLRISTLKAAGSLRNFIEHFFGCSECVQHFLSMYDSCWNDWCKLLDHDVSDRATSQWQNFPLWIWDLHNSVNIRLMKENAEHKHLKVSESDKINARWPSRTDCEECWNDDHSYNSDAVYRYLKHVYWEHNDKVLIKAKVSFEGKPRSQRFFLSVFAVIFLWLMTFWYVIRKRNIEMTGRHKKYDAEETFLMRL